MIDIQAIANVLEAQGGRFMLTHSGDAWAAAAQWGEEAPDSPMAAAAAYGMGATAGEAVSQLVADLS